MSQLLDEISSYHLIAVVLKVEMTGGGGSKIIKTWLISLEVLPCRLRYTLRTNWSNLSIINKLIEVSHF